MAQAARASVPLAMAASRATSAAQPSSASTEAAHVLARVQVIEPPFSSPRAPPICRASSRPSDHTNRCIQAFALRLPPAVHGSSVGLLITRIASPKPKRSPDLRPRRPSDYMNPHSHDGLPSPGAAAIRQRLERTHPMGTDLAGWGEEAGNSLTIITYSFMDNLVHPCHALNSRR